MQEDGTEVKIENHSARQSRNKRSNGLQLLFMSIKMGQALGRYELYGVRTSLVMKGMRSVSVLNGER